MNKLLLYGATILFCYAQSSNDHTLPEPPEKVVVRLDNEFQTIHSFGASGCWSAKFVGKWADERKKNHMTVNGKAFSPGGGSLNLKPGLMPAFANFLTEVSDHFGFDYLSPLNEPQWDWKAGKDGKASQEGTPAQNSDILEVTQALSKSLTAKNSKTTVVNAETAQLNFLYERASSGRGDQMKELFSGNPSLRNLPKVENILAYHSYFTTCDDANLVNTRRSAIQAARSVGNPDLWQSEFGVLGNICDKYSGRPRNTSIDYGLYVAKVIHNDLTITAVDPAAYLTDIKVELTKEWPKNRSITMLFHGHSVPAGYFKTPIVNTLDAYPNQLLKRLKNRYQYAVVNVLVTAIGGENSEQGAARFQNDVLTHKPDLVFIDYALNDRSIGLEKARRAWQTMIELAQRAGVKVILLTPSPDLKVDLGDPNNILNQHANQIRQLADRYQIGLVDSYRAVDAHRVEGDTLSRFMAQGNHPNKEGHALITDELIKWFVIPQANILPGQEWKATNSNVINAHGGGVYYEKGFYYWYGEHKNPGGSEQKGAADGGMHCYRSKDLINWQDFGVVMPVDRDNPNSDIAYGCIFQRPKVVYNGRTKKYAAYFKLYLKGNGYDIAHVGVGTASSPTGPFTYQGKFLAASDQGTGDFALYQEANGDLYHFAVRKTDRLMVKAKMVDDYLKPATKYVVCPGIVKSTEAPAILCQSGTYHLLGSGSSGWKPNAARYYTSSSLDGPWTDQGNPTHGTNPNNGLDSTKTFGGQSTCFIKVQGAENQYIAMFDDWKPGNPIDGRYIWLPFRVKKDRISINWVDRWDLGWFGNR